MKTSLGQELIGFTRDEKNMLVLLLHQELIDNIRSETVIRFLDADENDELVSSHSLLKSLFEGIDTTNLTP